MEEPFTIEDADGDIFYYQNELSSRQHVNLLSEGLEDSNVGPVCLSLEDHKSHGDEKKAADEKRAYLRTKKGNSRFMIPTESCTSLKEMIRYAKNLHPELNHLKLTELYDPDLVTKLVEYEKQAVITRFKFGLLYIKEGQSLEDGNVIRKCGKSYHFVRK